MDPRLLAAIAAITIPTIVTLRYLAVCYVKPFAHCWKCKGKGRIPHLIGRGSRSCRRCDGTGLRLRWGRHLLNHLRRLHRDGTRPTSATPPRTFGR